MKLNENHSYPSLRNSLCISMWIRVEFPKSRVIAEDFARYIIFNRESQQTLAIYSTFSSPKMLHETLSD